jgi:hypothetical protein
LELGPLMASLNDVYGVGTRQHLAFGRRRDEKEVTVGRFTCILKLVVSHNHQAYILLRVTI